MRLVIDTNVLLAAIFAPGLCREFIRKRCHAHELFCSPALLEEFAEKLRGKFALDPEKVPLFVAYRQRLQMVEPTPTPMPAPVCRDADDDLVLATALAANAGVILTGDKDLLVLKRYQTVRILSPRQFVEVLDHLQ